MQIDISGQHVEITAALHAHITAKIEKIVRHFDHLTNTHVVLHVEKTRHRAEATINTKGATLHASSTSDNMYTAIDSLTDKLDRQVLKHKEKLTNHHRRDDALKRVAK